MQEQSEIINFILSAILFIYYITLLKGFELKIPVFWVFAMFCIILSNVSTILEGYFLYELFDYMEHGLYMVAGLLFFIGAFRLKTF
jgi:hypothetical protein